VIDAFNLLLVEEVVPKICELLLKDSSALIRVSAAEALGEIGNNSNIGILDVVINDSSKYLIVRRYAKYSRELLSKEN
jgi:HEAT repeat protein